LQYVFLFNNDKKKKLFITIQNQSLPQTDLRKSYFWLNFLLQFNYQKQKGKKDAHLS
jgi:uncharacterized protein (DUF2225 family)